MKQPLFSPLTLALADEPELKGRIRRLLQAHLNREKLHPRQALLIALGVAAALIPLAIYQNGNHPEIVAAQTMSADTAITVEYKTTEGQATASSVIYVPAQQQAAAVTGVQMAPPAPPAPVAPPAPPAAPIR